MHVHVYTSGAKAKTSNRNIYPAILHKLTHKITSEKGKGNLNANGGAVFAVISDTSTTRKQHWRAERARPAGETRGSERKQYRIRYSMEKPLTRCKRRAIVFVNLG